jgi:ferredoxin
VTTVPVTFVEPDGTERVAGAVPVGRSLLEAAHGSGADLEGACGGELACSTCHVVLERRIYDALPEKTDEEEDMLDLAAEVFETYVSFSSLTHDGG